MGSFKSPKDNIDLHEIISSLVARQSEIRTDRNKEAFEDKEC